jgi:hypothetical protein
MVNRNLVSFISLVIVFSSWSNKVLAQVSVFSEINQMDDLRIKQVTGKDSTSNASFNLRSSSVFYKLIDPDRKFWQKNFGFELRNVGFLNQNNSTIGVGMNDGSLLPDRKSVV